MNGWIAKKQCSCCGCASSNPCEYCSDTTPQTMTITLADVVPRSVGDCATCMEFTFECDEEEEAYVAAKVTAAPSLDGTYVLNQTSSCQWVSTILGTWSADFWSGGPTAGECFELVGSPLYSNNLTIVLTKQDGNWHLLVYVSLDGVLPGSRAIYFEGTIAATDCNTEAGPINNSLDTTNAPVGESGIGCIQPDCETYDIIMAEEGTATLTPCS